MFPFSARVAWWMYRACPSIFAPLDASNVATLPWLATQAMNLDHATLRDRPTELRPFHFRAPHAVGARLWAKPQPQIPADAKTGFHRHGIIRSPAACPKESGCGIIRTPPCVRGRCDWSGGHSRPECQCLA